MAPKKFTQFPNLPAELRLAIWDAALYQETEHRIVVVMADQRHIIPTRTLLSPLLTVNAESRTQAEAFYTFAVPMHHYPRWSSSWDRSAEPPGRRAGTLHLNLERDIFLKGLDWHTTCNHMVRYHLRRKQRAWRVPHTYTTRPLSEAECGAVRRAFAVSYHVPEYDRESACPVCAEDCYLYEDGLDARIALFGEAEERFDLYSKPELPVSDNAMAMLVDGGGGMLFRNLGGLIRRSDGLPLVQVCEKHPELVVWRPKEGC